jgi:hypothetical protein
MDRRDGMRRVMGLAPEEGLPGSAGIGRRVLLQRWWRGRVDSETADRIPRRPFDQTLPLHIHLQDDNDRLESLRPAE